MLWCLWDRGINLNPELHFSRSRCIGKRKASTRGLWRGVSAMVGTRCLSKIRLKWMKSQSQKGVSMSRIEPGIFRNQLAQLAFDITSLVYKTSYIEGFRDVNLATIISAPKQNKSHQEKGSPDKAAHQLPLCRTRKQNTLWRWIKHPDVLAFVPLCPLKKGKISYSSQLT